MSKVSKNIQEAYNEQYRHGGLSGWRDLGAKYKTQNILRLCGNNKFPKVLEYGAGSGSILKYLDHESIFDELNALEISESGVQLIKQLSLEKIKDVLKFDGYSTPYADNEFDLVYCSHVLEHVENPRAVLREIKRIGKKHIFEVPLDYSRNIDKKIEHYLEYGHINVFTPALFKFLIRSEGFNIENDLHTNLASEVLQYNSNMLHEKSSIKKKLLSFILSQKGAVARSILGNTIAEEYYFSAYTCLTAKGSDLSILSKFSGRKSQ